jgi:polyferredoxin
MKQRKLKKYFELNKIRAIVLFLALFVINGHFYVLNYPKMAEIFKHIPLPILNCYSTPTTIWSCPAGLIQHFLVIGGFTFATIGILLIFGALLGRWFCGWICPFGLFQEILYWIPAKKFELPKWTRGIKHFIFLIMVILMPMYFKNSIGMTETWFCNFCPAGCLEAGIPTVIIDPSIRYLIGTMYWIKIAILVILVIIPSIFIKRPFCTTICPVGLMMGFTNRFSFLKLSFNKSKCNNCGLCSVDCPMGLNPTTDFNSSECIRCMNCTKEWCGAIKPEYSVKTVKIKEMENI